MRTPLVLALLLAVACGRAPNRSGAVTLSPGDLWIRDVTLVSPERDRPVPNRHVVVRNGRILAVTAETPRPVPAGVVTLDGTNKFLAPGLIDGHVHLAMVPGLLPEHESAQRAIVDAYYAQLPRSYLYFGFTTVVDLNVIDRETLNRLKRSEPAPEILDCDSGLALANGYPMAYLPPLLRFERYTNFLYDPRQAPSIPAKFRPEDHSPSATVSLVAKAGGVCVKSYYEPGFAELAGKLPVPTTEMMREVGAATRQKGIPLLLHANSLAAHKFAVDVGADAVVHGMWNWGRAESESGTLPAEVTRVLDDERKGGMGMMPTVRVIGGLADLFNPEFLQDPQLLRVLPRGLIDWYQSSEGQWFARQTGKSFEGLPPERAHRIMLDVQARGERAAVRFALDGGRLLFGSDTPSAPTFANPPGYNGFLELRALEAAGIPAHKLLAAATVENAKLFGLSRDYGTIEPGKVANMILLTADPLESVSAFDRIDTVIVKGRAIPRTTLAAKQ